MGMQVDGTGDGISPLSKARRTAKVVYNEPVEQTSRSAPQVNLSAQAQQVRELRKAVEGAPSMNASRVEELKQQVQNGTYEVDSEKLARVMETILR